MATITLTFAKDINKSVQVGDTIYRCTMSGTVASDPIEIGTVTAVTAKTITCNISIASTRPTTNDFIMFSKDNKANMSSLMGYYAKVQMKNNSTSEAELFSLETDFFESSK